MTDYTPEDLAPSDEPVATATAPTTAVVVPLTKDQQASVQAELDKQNAKPAATPTKDKPRVRAGGPVDKKVDKPAPPATATPIIAGSQPDPLLVDILCWPRRHDSPAELAFVKWLQALPMVKDLKMTKLALDSWAWTVPGKGDTEVMFSCHVDTVDDWQSCQQASAKKKLVYDPAMSIIGLDTSHKVGTCLGADDGAGIWLMLKMIEAKVPGTYVFHRGEEVGGLSAKGNAKDHKAFFSTFKQAIAFDRHMNTDVIIQQGGSICASATYGAALAAALNAGSGFAYKEATNGVFTDTKEYRGIISECVNIAVGYQSQHGSSEFQDWEHLEGLMKKVTTMKWHELPTSREPHQSEPAGYGGSSWQGRDWSGSRGSAKGLQDDFFGRDSKKGRDKEKGTRRSGSGRTTSMSSMVSGEDLDYYTYGDLFALVDDDPEKAKDVLIAYMRERARLMADIVTLEGIVEELK